MRRPERGTRPLTVRLGIVAGVFLFCCGSLRPDELECEEAVAYIDHCCPGQHAALDVSCAYVPPEGCCGDDDECGGRNPDIDQPQSECLRKIACNGLCAALSGGAKVGDLCSP